MTRLEEVTQRIGARPALVRIEDVSASFGDAAPYRIEDGIAIIDVFGTLSNARWSWGGTTYGDIQDQVKIASLDPNVRGVLLHINSPGGETDNAFETAAMIASMEKPCWASVETSAYSAAYLLASQADKIYVTPVSGGVGSIGVFCLHFDMSEMLSQMGVKPTFISAGKGKTDGNPYEPLSKDAYNTIKANVDSLYDEFVGAVAKGRGMAAADITAFGAKTFRGQAAAIGNALADAPGDLSTAWADMCMSFDRPATPLMPFGSAANIGSVASATEEQPKEKSSMAETAKPEQQGAPLAGLAAEVAVGIPTAAEIEKMVTNAKAEGRSQAALVASLCSVAGKPELIAGFLAAGKSAEDVGAELLAAKAEADKKTALNTGVMPGADTGAKPEETMGKAKPWGEVLRSLGFAKKEGK